MKHLIVPRTRLYISEAAVFAEYEGTDGETYRAEFSLRDDDKAVFAGTFLLRSTRIEVEEIDLEDLPQGVRTVVKQTTGRDLYVTVGEEGSDGSDGDEIRRGVA